MRNFFYLLDLENDVNFDEFRNVFYDLQPQLRDLVVSKYQSYLTDKLGSEVNTDEVKEYLERFYEDYPLTAII